MKRLMAVLAVYMVFSVAFYDTARAQSVSEYVCGPRGEVAVKVLSFDWMEVEIADVNGAGNYMRTSAGIYVLQQTLAGHPAPAVFLSQCRPAPANP